MSSRNILVGAVALLALGGALWYLNSSLGGLGDPSTREFTFVVEDGKLVDGPSELEVNEGDTVIITITTNEEEELHLHGYDRSIDLAPGEAATLTFVADMSGKYPFELERSKTELGTLIVVPN